MDTSATVAETSTQDASVSQTHQRAADDFSSVVMGSPRSRTDAEKRQMDMNKSSKATRIFLLAIFVGLYIGTQEVYGKFSTRRSIRGRAVQRIRDYQGTKPGTPRVRIGHITRHVRHIAERRLGAGQTRIFTLCGACWIRVRLASCYSQCSIIVQLTNVPTHFPAETSNMYLLLMPGIAVTKHTADGDDKDDRRGIKRTKVHTWLGIIWGHPVWTGEESLQDENSPPHPKMRTPPR